MTVTQTGKRKPGPAPRHDALRALGKTNIGVDQTTRLAIQRHAKERGMTTATFMRELARQLDSGASPIAPTAGTTPKADILAKMENVLSFASLPSMRFFLAFIEAVDSLSGARHVSPADWKEITNREQAIAAHMVRLMKAAEGASPEVEGVLKRLKSGLAEIMGKAASELEAAQAKDDTAQPNAST